MSKVIIRKVDEEYGWLGNMSPHPVEHDGYMVENCGGAISSS